MIKFNTPEPTKKIPKIIKPQPKISISISKMRDWITIPKKIVIPPRKNKPTLVDGLTSNDMFVKANMEDELSGKVRRNNNLVVEIQGAVIITSKWNYLK